MSSVCSNCGKPGHFFRECSEPITSLGILAFRRTVTGQKRGIEGIQWLLIRRRDTLGFIEIMRGKYDLRDEEGIQVLIDQTTLTERQRLLTKPFNDLWIELWNGPASRRYHAEYEQAKAKFDVLRSGGNTGGVRKRMEEYCAASGTAWLEPEWGFPKGRRSSMETELTCALRETWEEAGIESRDLHVLATVHPILEEFMGSNGVRYRHRYWLAESPSTLEVTMDPKNVNQTREVGAVRWTSTEEAYDLIRPYNMEKRSVLAAGIVAISTLREDSHWD
jgi:8-oxo-dGTP pyrophosphatase MutT (NUDIX family)